MDNPSFIKRDLGVVWHPCTQMKDHEWLALIPIRKAQGVFLEDFDGKHYLDAISSWWVNIFGHCHPCINAAIKEQLDTLEHVLLAGFTHEPVVSLSERLIALAPPGMQRCFYAENGSAAVEIALKMSYHYWQNRGKKQKNKFLSLSNSYHGETLGALAVGNVSLYKSTYGPLLMPTLTAPSPDCFYREHGETWENYSRRLFVPMAELLEKNAHEICAVIVEPLVQCAGSMRMYHPVYLSLLREACDHYGVHLIADEIAVGIGRTGTFFACEQASITPDFLCVGKGLTGGYLPLSAVITTEVIYREFYADDHYQRAFLHSHSYTGNPLACRAALATLDIFAADQTLSKNQRLITAMANATERFHDHPHIGEVRQTGMILAIEMVHHKADKQAFARQERRGLKVYQHGLKNGVLLRPLGDVIYFMPPYIITPEQIEYIAEVAWEGICLATRS